MIHRESWYREADERELARLEAELSRGDTSNLQQYLQLLERTGGDRAFDDRITELWRELYWAFADDAKVMDRRFGSGWTGKYLNFTNLKPENKPKQERARKAYNLWVNYTRGGRRGIMVEMKVDPEAIGRFFKERHWLLSEGIPALQSWLGNQLR